MWWLILGIACLVLLLVAGGLFGWLMRGVEMVLSFLFEGWNNLFGCLLKLILFPICIYVLVQVVIGLLS